MKKKRVLIIGSEEYYYHDEGAYGEIFVNESRTHCWKLFKVKDLKYKSGESFKSELKAYKLAACDSDVARMVPKLFRNKCITLQVFDEQGRDVSAQYIPELNYEMEFLDLEFTKLGNPNENTSSTRNKFKKAGISNLSDASIAYDVDGNPKLIDFGIHEIEVWH